MTTERICAACAKPIKAGEPRVVFGPDHWQEFKHKACDRRQAEADKARQHG